MATLINELKSELKKETSLYLMSKSFSIFALNKLKENLKELSEVKLLISNTNLKNFFDDEFELLPEERINLSEIIFSLIEFIEKDSVQIKKNENIPGSFIITEDSSRMGFVETVNEKILDSSDNKLFNKTERNNDVFCQNTFSQYWNAKETVDVKTEIIRKLKDLISVSANDAYYFTLQKLFENESDNDENLATTDFDKLKESEIWKLMYKFQRDGVEKICDKLNRYGICILADSVGLGKTFSALGVIKDYQLQGKRILVLCPKKLEKNWTQYLANANRKNNILDKDNFDYSVVFHTDLLRKKGGHGNIDFENFNWGAFGLVVIDESHNFRTGISSRKDSTGRPVENRYSFLLDHIIKGESKPKLLLLSATPVNNRFLDMQNQLRLAYDGDEDAFNKKLPVKKSVETLFKTADKTFKKWAKEDGEKTTDELISRLQPDFLDLLETVSIARSRNHIKTFYNDADLKTFPKHLEPIQIQEYADGASENYENIAMNLEYLNLSLYDPYSYIRPDKKDSYYELFVENNQENLTTEGRIAGTVKLMRINILKRLESSTESFLKTIDGIKNKINEYINAIESFKQKPPVDKIQNKSLPDISFFIDNDFIEDILEENPNIMDANDFTEDEDFSIQKGKDCRIKISDMNYENWELSLKEDLSLLHEISDSVNKGSTEDVKLDKLKDIIRKKIEHPINGENKKILIFTAFADTAEYLYDNIKDWADKKFHINSAIVTGTGCDTNLAGIGNDFDKILTYFSPKSKNRDLIYGEQNGEIDILIATDCISEGQNLQDCDYLINYDIHWNPVRIIQRFGRIDRIGSDNTNIQLVNFWPNKDLDVYIKLKNRVEAKMTATVLSGAGVGNILTNDDTSKFDFRAEQIRNELKEQPLDEQSVQLIRDIENMKSDTFDARSSFVISDYTLAGYKNDLKNYDSKSSIEQMPNSILTVVSTENKSETGAVFVFKAKEKSKDDTKAKKRLNRLYPYQFVQIKDNGETSTDGAKILSVLRELCKDNKNRIQYNQYLEKLELLQKALNALSDKNIKDTIASLFSPEGMIVETNKNPRKNELISCFLIK